MPSMRRGFTQPVSTSLDHTTAQVEGDAEDRAKGQREVTRGAISGKSLARLPCVAPESRGAAPDAQGPCQLAGDNYRFGGGLL